MSPVKFPADGLFAGPTMFSSFLIMSQMKAGASLFGGRLLKSAATSALALSVVAGGVMLSGGEAKAVACDGISTITFTDTGLNPPVTFTDKCELLSNTVGTDPNYVRIIGNPMWPNVQTTVNFDGPSITTGEVHYKMTKTAPDGPEFYFDAFQLRWEPPAVGTGSITKSIYSDENFTNLIASSSTNGGVVPLPNHYKDLWVSDVVTTTGGGVIPNMNNDFRNVPGPLPVLGAGAAFGFSRKLRSRIKAARTA